MRTIIAAASLCVMASLNTASAHPTGDGHHFRNSGFGFGFHTRIPAYGYGPRYVVPHYRQPRYQSEPYQPIQPTYGSVYQSAPSQQIYVAPQASYHGVPQYHGTIHRSNTLDLPASEGFNFGYSGGPTFGRGRNRVINGVEIFGPPR